MSCYKCTKREFNCHSKCEEYKKFREEKEKEYKDKKVYLDSYCYTNSKDSRIRKILNNYY